MSLLVTDNATDKNIPPSSAPVQNLNVPPSPPQQKPASFPEQVWAMLACFRSVQLAIVLLSLLALGTMVGVMLPQEGLIDPIEIKRQYGANYRTLKAMGFFNVYSSYWFLTLEVLFFFNLLFGSFQWLKPAFKASTQTTFLSAGHIQATSSRLDFETADVPLVATETISRLLRKARYTVRQDASSNEQEVRLYACKGNFSRLGPVVAHFGILLMLVASVYGTFTGFKAQKLAVPGETFSIQDAQMFLPNIQEPLWQGAVPGWKIRVNDFRIEYYPEDQAPPGNAVVQQYYADLSLLDSQGKESRREVISVNHPMMIDDVALYQASFNPTGKLFLEVNGKALPVSVNTEFMDRPVSFTELDNGLTLMAFPFFVQQDPNVTRNYVVLFLRDSKGFVGARPGEMPPNLRLREGESGQLNGLSLKYIKPEIATGLQIKKGPEVPWMYLSYIIIILGTIMCVFSQRQLWVAIQGNRVSVMYRTNKARLSFMKELQRLQLETRKQLSPPLSATEPAP